MGHRKTIHPDYSAEAIYIALVTLITLRTYIIF